MTELRLVWQTVERMGRSLLKLLPYLVLGILVFLAFYFAAKLVRTLVRRLSSRARRHGNLAIVLGRLAQAIMVLVGLLVSLSIVVPSFQVGDLIQFLGIGSVAIGFAFRDVLQNFLAGILLLLTEPFRVGDQIVFDKFEGTVEEIQTRATFLRTYDGRLVVIPNANLFTNSVTVNTAYEHRRMQYDVGIGVGDDIERAKEVILEAVRSVEGVLADPAPQVLVWDLADFSVKLRIWWFIAPPTRQEDVHTRDRVLGAIKRRLIEIGVDLPFPTYQILLHDQTEESDGDRRHQREGWPAGEGRVPRPRALASAINRPAAGEVRNDEDGQRPARTA